MHEISFVKEIIDAFVSEPFSHDERHVRRIKKISDFENKG
jgi:ribose 5-phosphate isomerase B